MTRDRNEAPDDRSEYPRLEAAQVEELRFRSVAPAHLAAIRERVRNVSRGGVVAPTSERPAVNSIAEIRYRPAPDAEPVEAVGLVRWVEAKPPAAGIQFVRVGGRSTGRSSRRMVRKEGGSRPATTVYAEGPVLYVRGDLGSGAYNGFVSCWAKTLGAQSDRLIIDLSGVTRISSMGVGLLVGAHMDATKQDKSLTIKAPASFQRLLAVSGMDKVARFVYVDPRGGRVEAAANGGREIEADAVIGGQDADGEGAPSGDAYLRVDDAGDPVAEAEETFRRELDNIRRERGEEG